MRKYLLIPGLLVLALSCQLNVDQDVVTGVIHQKGMVVSAHPIASSAGNEVLKEGGNAVDAAIATELALAVVYPTAGNIGGGGFMLIRQPDGTSTSIDYREKAPMRAQRDMYLDENGEVIRGMSTRTHAASGVPGTIAGLYTAWQKFGSMPFERLIQPAIDLARDGFPLTANQASRFNRMKRTFQERNTHPIPLVKETEWQEGDTLRQLDLAETLVRIQEKGREGFYRGETAACIVAEMKKGNGLITAEDLIAYQAIERKPISTRYRDYKVTSMSPPSSGGVALIQLLGMVEDYPLQEWGFHSREAVHLMIEAEKRVYADRAKYLGDPDYVEIPVAGLTNPDYLKERMSDFLPDQARASDEISHGNPVFPAESKETTHYSVVDKNRMAVATTTTLNGGYGTGIMVEGAGFFLNNEMDDFSVKPGYPNIYGLIGGEANAIKGGKRMLSSMTPTLVEKNGKLFMVLGSPGGSTIITSVFQTLLNVIDFEMGMQEAVNAGRFHHQWMPDVCSLEEGSLDSLLIRSLEAMGHSFRNRGSIGRVDAILVLADDALEGGADPRGDDTAVGY